MGRIVLDTYHMANFDSLILGSFSLHVKSERDAELQVAPDSFVLSIELKICIGNVDLSWQVVSYCQNQHVSKGTTFTLKVNSRHLPSSSHSSQFHCCTTCNRSNLIQTKATTEVFSAAPCSSFWPILPSNCRQPIWDTRFSSTCSFLL